jgi:hypothetical protein
MIKIGIVFEKLGQVTSLEGGNGATGGSGRVAVVPIDRSDQGGSNCTGLKPAVAILTKLQVSKNTSKKTKKKKHKPRVNRARHDNVVHLSLFKYEKTPKKRKKTRKTRKKA